MEMNIFSIVTHLNHGQQKISMKKLVVADDHPIVLDGIKLLLNDSIDYQIVGTATSVTELISKCLEDRPDLVILDINLKGKNSLDHLESFKLQFPRCKVIIFSSYNNSKLIKKALDQKADGYLLKDATRAEWMDALENVFEDKVHLGKGLRVRPSYIGLSEIEKDNFSLKTKISNQEKNIILCIVDGKKEQEIAEFLHISKNTVHTHKKNILKKLSLHSNAELVKFAYENDLVS